MGVEIHYENRQIADLLPGAIATLPCKDMVMKSDLTVTVPQGGGGAQERDFYILACHTKAAYGNGITPLIRYTTKEAGTTPTGYQFVHFAPSISGTEFHVYAKIPKGHQVYLTYVADSSGDFRYFKSQTLGFELTARGANTGWLDINSDVTDLECYAEGTPEE